MTRSLTPRQEDAQRRIHALLTELAEIIGPDDDGQADWEPGEAPQGTLTLWEWGICCYWVDGASRDFYTVLPASEMPQHHTVGLLRAALAYYEAAG